MLEKLKEIFLTARVFLRKIQRSDEKTKKRWVVALSAVAIVLIFSVWLFYLSFTIPKAAVETGGGTPPAQEEGFFKIMKKGFERIGAGAYGSFVDVKNYFSELAGQGKEYFERTREIFIDRNPNYPNSPEYAE